MVEDPEWVLDMVNTMLDSSIALLEMVMEAGYSLTASCGTTTWLQRSSVHVSAMYRNLFKPADRRAAEWAHARGPPVYYHSCGNLGRWCLSDRRRCGYAQPLEVNGDGSTGAEGTIRR